MEERTKKKEERRNKKEERTKKKEERSWKKSCLKRQRTAWTKNGNKTEDVKKVKKSKKNFGK